MSDHTDFGRLSGIGNLLVNVSRDIRQEVVRKLLHLLIATTPTICFFIGTPATIALLGVGVTVYAIAEYLRMSGVRVPIISGITEVAMRTRDRNHFVLGPVTLGIGAMIALLFYPEPAASIAIYALAFGDGFASLAGKLIGTVKIPFTGGKSLEGSIACFVAVLVSTIVLVPSIPIPQGVVIALAATVLEAIPAKDFDNLVMPVGTGLVAMLLV